MTGNSAYLTGLDRNQANQGSLDDLFKIVR
jgi:hypothetical protein